MQVSNTDLELKTPRAELVDETKPLSSMQVFGRWLREALDYHTYLQLGEEIGEDVATYKNAYDSGSFGTFDGSDFSKETAKAAVRTVSDNSLRIIGHTTKMMGENIKAHPYLAHTLSVGLTDVMPKVGDDLVRFGSVMEQAADSINTSDFLRPDDDVYDDDPNWTKTANLIGQSSAQVLTMGTLAKYIGAKATYGLFSLGGASAMYDDARTHQQSVDSADTSALLNGGVSYALDRLFAPLPKQIEQRAKMTSKEIAKEMLGSPFRECGTEVLQQLGAENMVRYAGFDDTQDLFEGLVESALGGMVGSAVLNGADGTLYEVRKTYREAKQKLLLKGISAEALSLAERDMQTFIEKHPEAFEKVLRYGIEENLKLVENQPKFQKLYRNMYQKAYQSLGNKTEAGLAAAVLEANALMLYQSDPSVTPEMFEDVPTIRRIDFDTFAEEVDNPQNVLFQFGGKNARYADLDKLTTALDMEKADRPSEEIWLRTGWHRGDDGLMRFEISDDKAKLKLWETSEIEEKALAFLEKDKKVLENNLDDYVRVLEQTPKDIVPYLGEFEKFLTAHYENSPQNEQQFLQDWEKARYDDLNIKRDLVTIAATEKKKAFEDGNFTFSAEDYQLVKALSDEADWIRFKHDNHYPRGNYHTLFSKVMTEKLASLYENGDDLLNLAAFIDKVHAEQAQYGQMLADKGLQKNDIFFNDFWLKKTYELTKFPQAVTHTEIPDGLYKQAYRDKKLSEIFLTQAQMPEFSAVEMERLSAFLDKEEQAFLLNRYLQKLNDKHSLLSKILYQDKHLLFWEQSPEAAEKLIWQKRILLQSGLEKTLGEILEHPELYKHYPQLEQMKVRFGRLPDNEAYHFFTDENGQYVLEADAEQLGYTDLKEVMLKGAQYAIQNIEDFDVTLSPKQMQNFMDRSLYMAKEYYSPKIRRDMQKFVEQYLPDKKLSRYLSPQKMPVALLGIYQSHIDNKPSTEEVTYLEPNFDMLEQDLLEKYGQPKTEDEKTMRQFVAVRARELRAVYQRNLINSQRLDTGITLPNTLWGRESYAAAFEDRARRHRQNMTAQNRRDTPYWRKRPPITPEIDRRDDSRDVLERSPDFYDAYTHEKFDQTVKDLARGAYDKANRTITLFKTESAETIIHETAHYFHDVLAKNTLHPHVQEIYRHSSEALREEFVRRYRIIRQDGKYYVTDKKDGMIAEELAWAFDTPLEALTVGTEELFATTFTDSLLRQTDLKRDSDVNVLAHAYGQWLKRLITNLNIKKSESSVGGGKIIQYLRTKLR